MQKKSGDYSPLRLLLDFLLNRLLPIHFAESCCPIIGLHLHSLEHKAVAVFRITHIIPNNGSRLITGCATNFYIIFYTLGFFYQIFDKFGGANSNKRGPNWSGDCGGGGVHMFDDYETE